jgi:uncharacterized repeat protein (TIGR01451 family)
VRLQVDKRAEAPTPRHPGDTITYTLFYDNDGDVASVDTAEMIDYIPKNSMYIDTLACSLHTGGTKRVWWLPRNGVWTLTQPARAETVQALKWQISPNIGAQSSSGDVTGADSLRGVGVDTTTGADAGRIKFRVRIR